jgi:hypothetical protein
MTKQRTTIRTIARHELNHLLDLYKPMVPDQRWGFGQMQRAYTNCCGRSLPSKACTDVSSIDVPSSNVVPSL